MQAAIVNPFLSIAAAPAPKDAQNASNEEGAGTSSFYALVDDAQTQTDDSADQGANPEHLSDVGSTVSAAALAAQEVESEEKTLEDLLAQEVTPENIADLLADLDFAMTQQHSSAEQEQLKALKAELLALQDAGESSTVGALLGQITATKPQLVEDGGTARMLNWLHKALAKKQGGQEMALQDDVLANAQNALSAVVQSLQASLFRTGDAADAAAPESQQTGEEKRIVTIVPLTQLTLIQAQAMPAVAPASVASTDMELSVPSAAAPVEKGFEVADTPSLDMAGLDALIPPLDSFPDETLPQAKSAATLPEVDLPRLANAQVDAPDTSSTPSVAASQAMEKNADAAMAKLSPMVESAQLFVPQAGTKVEAKESAVTAATTDAAEPVTTVSNTQSPVATQTSQAVKAPAAVSEHSKLLKVPVGEQVHVAIKKASAEGMDKITIQLDPVELGRVEVKMQVAQDGQTQISFTVDKASTFDALSRDARALERTLQDAGIKADAGSMQFNLRQQPQGQMESGMGQGGNHGQHAQQQRAEDEANALQAAAAVTKNYTLNMREGVDIRA